MNVPQSSEQLFHRPDIGSVPERTAYLSDVSLHDDQRPAYYGFERPAVNVSRGLDAFPTGILLPLPENCAPAVTVDSYYQLGMATHIDGRVGTRVTADAAHLTFASGAHVPGRTIGGVLYSIEAPAGDDPLRFHYVESRNAHREMCRVLGMSMSHEMNAVLHLSDNKTAMGILYYADSSEPPTVHLFFSETAQPGHDLIDDITVKGVTAAVMNTVGYSLVTRTPEAKGVLYTISRGDATTLQHLGRADLMQGIAPSDINWAQV